MNKIKWRKGSREEVSCAEQCFDHVITAIVYNHSPITLTSTKLWSNFYIFICWIDTNISTIIPVCENSQSLYCCCYGWVSRTLAWCISCPSCGVCRLENSTPGTLLTKIVLHKIHLLLGSDGVLARYKWILVKKIGD